HWRSTPAHRLAAPPGRRRRRGARGTHRSSRHRVSTTDKRASPCRSSLRAATLAKPKPASQPVALRGLDSLPRSALTVAARKGGSRMSEEPVDVLIVGAGAAGAAFAWSLADTRMNIVCLERGDWMDPADYSGS